MTRIQKERFTDMAEYEAARGEWGGGVVGVCGRAEPQARDPSLSTPRSSSHPRRPPCNTRRAAGKYVIDAKTLGALKKRAVVLHPLPRVDEISTDVDADPRAAYFRQARNGLYIRMALIKMALT